MKLPVLRGGVMRVCLILVAIALGSCTAQNQYIRADGRYAAPESIEAARAACSPESDSNLCMMEKGYFSVSAKEAEAKRSQLAAIVQKNEEERQAKLAALAAEQAREKARERALKEALNKKKRKQSTAGSPWPPR
jgi:hypothetical protein